MNRFGTLLVRLIVWIGGICCLPITGLMAQISEGGTPPSFQFANRLRHSEQVIQIPVDFSVEDLKAVNAWQVSQGGAMQIAKVIDTDLNITKDGEWITLPNGQQVWQLHLQAKDAIALLLLYSDFYIPEGGKLYIYNEERSHLLGAYTTASHPENGAFSTELVAGDEVILEYQPASSGEMPQLRINGIGYGYNHLYISRQPTTRAGKDESGICMVNINCEEGDEWQLQKRGVCQMMQKIGDGYYACTGSVVNNTALDKKPYILSAFHCSEGSNGIATEEDLKQWQFYFNFEREGCDNDSPAIDYRTMIGCTRVASIPLYTGSDGLLLLLNQQIPDSYNVFYNGWDRTNAISPSGVGIHHPSGDYKKISTYGERPASTMSWTPKDGPTIQEKNVHWNVFFDATLNGHAVTEGGSSGSPLFNEAGLIIGTLTGGSSSCEAVDGANLYGKMSAHWNRFASTSDRMDIWLDPLQTGATRLNGMTSSGEIIPAGLKPPTDLTAEKQDNGSMHLTWKAPLFKQVIGWGDGLSGMALGFEGAAFYFGQKWLASELKPLHKKTITAVNFVTVKDASYKIYIEQGSRSYTEEVIALNQYQSLSYPLKTPFTINAEEDLIVSLFTYKYDEVAACMDANPAVDGKGNICALADKKWETVPLNEANSNFAISFTVTSEEGEITKSTPQLRSNVAPLQPKNDTRLTVKQVKMDSNSTVTGSLITDFPITTGYRIDKDALELVTLPASAEEYIDKNASTSPIYEVYALYNENKSLPAVVETNTTVANEQLQANNTVDIYPTLFDGQVTVTGNEQVESIEIYTIGGQLVNKIQRPGSTIPTGMLPQGVYIFKLTTPKEVKTVQAIKR